MKSEKLHFHIHKNFVSSKWRVKTMLLLAFLTHKKIVDNEFHTNQVSPVLWKCWKVTQKSLNIFTNNYSWVLHHNTCSYSTVWDTKTNHFLITTILFIILYYINISLLEVKETQKMKWHEIQWQLWSQFYKISYKKRCSCIYTDV